jgi:hypothetical protein
VINFTVAKPLNKCLLKVLLQELSAPHSELIPHTDVHWLSAGSALSQVWELFEGIKGFISSNSHYHLLTQLYEDDLKITLAFMVDLFEYLNGLNLHFLGQEILSVI